jgi:uncharacterized protein with PIN domain/sulfur carrier protein ThiS
VRVTVWVRCYAELNDFLGPSLRQAAFAAECESGASVKDLLESLGVPHTEIDLLLVNGETVGFDRRLSAGDRVAAYPVFEAFDIATATRVRPEPLREVRFVLDGHLGRLAAFLRLAGFDVAYSRDAPDAELAATAARERRILLTRDHGLLKRRAVTHGALVRNTAPAKQLGEVIARFHLSRLVRPFTRCMRCNGLLVPVPKETVADRVPACSWSQHDRFLECPDCRRVYWEGSHHERLRRLVAQAVAGTTSD